MLKCTIRQLWRHSSIAKFDERGQLRRYALEAGQSHGNFIVKRVYASKEFNSIYYEMQHSPSGARYVHLSTPNVNNQGALLFHTPSHNQQGIPHIVHRICCAGSEKYPVRDAWSHMHSRSLNSRDMEPSLGPDYTLYPLQSWSVKDYYQLFDLTFEQVFRPWNRLADFLLEGVRLQIVGNEVLARGEIYEEMKNNFNIGEFIHAEYVKASLGAGSIYQYCSGGIPQEMLATEHSDVTKYFHQYINTSNLSIITLGDMDLLSHLDYFDKALNGLAIGKPAYTDQSYQTNNKYPRRANLSYPPQHQEESLIHLGLAFKGADLRQNPSDFMSLLMLSHLLHEVPGLGLQQYLSEDAPRYTFNHGTNTNLRSQQIIIGLATRAGYVARYEQQLINFLHQLKTDHNSILPQHETEIAIQRTMFKRTLNIQDLVPFILHQVDPKQFLSSANNQQLYSQIPTLVEKYLSHDYATILMEPNNDHIYETERREKLFLKKIFEDLTESRIRELSEQSEIVSLQQEQIQTLDSLPMIEITQVLPALIRTNMRIEQIGYGIPVYLQPSRTPGSSTIHVSFDITGLSLEDIGSVNVMRVLQPFLFEKHQLLGQLACNLQETNLESFTFQYQLEFLDKNTEECAGRLFEIIADPDLDDLETLSNAISTVSALAGNELTEKAVKYAIDYCSSAFGVKDYSEYQQLRDICNIQTDLLKNYDIKPKLQELSDRLITTYYKLMNKNKLKIQVSSPEENVEPLKRQIVLFINTMKRNFEGLFIKVNEFNDQYHVRKDSPVSEKENLKTYVTIPSGSNYVTETIPLNAPFGHQRCPTYQVMSSFLNQFSLLQYQTDAVFQVSSTFNPIRGTMTFFTYRDPNTISSYKLFEQAIHDLLDNPPEYDRPLIISKTQLNQAKVDLVRRLYSNEFPNNEFVHGISDETRANYVQAILAVGGIELQEAAKPLLKAMADGNTSQVIFGMNQKGLEGMVKRGWAITRLIEGVSMQPEQYSQVTETRYEPPELI